MKRRRRYHKLVRVRPRKPGEALDSDKAIGVQLPSVNHIGSFFSTFRDYQIAAKSVGGGSKFRQRELSEGWNLVQVLVMVKVSGSISEICFGFLRWKRLLVWRSYMGGFRLKAAHHQFSDCCFTYTDGLRERVQRLKQVKRRKIKRSSSTSNEASLEGFETQRNCEKKSTVAEMND